MLENEEEAIPHFFQAGGPFAADAPRCVVSRAKRLMSGGDVALVTWLHGAAQSTCIGKRRVGGKRPFSQDRSRRVKNGGLGFMMNEKGHSLPSL